MSDDPDIIEVAEFEGHRLTIERSNGLDHHHSPPGYWEVWLRRPLSEEGKPQGHLSNQGICEHYAKIDPDAEITDVRVELKEAQEELKSSRKTLKTQKKEIGHLNAEVARLQAEIEKRDSIFEVKSAQGMPLSAFTMVRNADESGISGTGRVLDGVVWHNGAVTVMWRTDVDASKHGYWSSGVYPSFEAFKFIHIDSHPTNKTEIIMHEADFERPSDGAEHPG
jgi:hypothetical protein